MFRRKVLLPFSRWKSKPSKKRAAVDFPRTTQHYNPEGPVLHIHCSDSLKRNVALSLENIIFQVVTPYSLLEAHRSSGLVASWDAYVGLLTNFMELNLSWRATSCAAMQEFSSILRNPKASYHVHKSPPLIPILRQINAVHITPSYLRSISILSTHLRLVPPSSLFPSGFPTNILPNSCYMPCHSHP
jgi:hypothetical protein